MASEVLMTISKDGVERARLMSELKYELDTQGKPVHARREGLQKGLQKARREKLESARKLRERGVSDTEIAGILNMLPEELPER